MNFHRKTILALVMLVAGVTLLPGTSAARIKCWTNSEGVRECGNAVPPEYSQQKTEVKSKSGLTVETKARAKTPEEIAAEEKAEREREEQARRDKEQAERDRVLLATFTTEQDLLLTRDGQLAAIDSRIRHSTQLVERLEGDLAALQEEAARQERAGKKVSEDTAHAIEDVQARIDEQRSFIAGRKQEKVELRAKFDTDLARYRELKSR